MKSSSNPSLISWSVDVRLPEKGNSNFYGARPVHFIITMLKWTRTSRLSMNNSLSNRSVVLTCRTTRTSNAGASTTMGSLG